MRDILSQNGIDYIVKTTNLQTAPILGNRRAHTGSFGINPDYSYEYKIYVHKKDYVKAVSLIKWADLEFDMTKENWIGNNRYVEKIKIDYSFKNFLGGKVQLKIVHIKAEEKGEENSYCNMALKIMQ